MAYKGIHKLMEKIGWAVKMVEEKEKRKLAFFFVSFSPAPGTLA